MVLLLLFCQNHVCGGEADARETAGSSCAGLLWRVHEMFGVGVVAAAAVGGAIGVVVGAAV